MARRSGLYRLGGLSFMISGALLFLRYLLEIMARPPPSGGEEILAWAASSRWPLAMGIELQFAGMVILVPAVGALHASLSDEAPAMATTGCGLLAAVIPVSAVVEVVRGRLVFPVNGLLVRTPDVAELVVAIVLGGVHVAWLLAGAATIALSLAMWRGRHGKRIALLGFVTGCADVGASYPWMLGTAPLLVAQALFSAWFVAVGWKLHGMAAPVQG